MLAHELVTGYWIQGLSTQTGVLCNPLCNPECQQTLQPLEVSAAQAPAGHHPCCLRAAFCECGRPQISQTPSTPPNPAPRSLRIQCSMFGIGKPLYSPRLAFLSEWASLLIQAPEELASFGSHISSKCNESAASPSFSNLVVCTLEVGPPHDHGILQLQQAKANRPRTSSPYISPLPTANLRGLGRGAGGGGERGRATKPDKQTNATTTLLPSIFLSWGDVEDQGDNCLRFSLSVESSVKRTISRLMSAGHVQT